MNEHINPASVVSYLLSALLMFGGHALAVLDHHAAGIGAMVAITTLVINVRSKCR